MSSVLQGFYWISISRCFAADQIIIWNCNIQAYAGFLLCFGNKYSEQCEMLQNE